MKYTITQEQVNGILSTIYQTNITASVFDAVKKFFSELPKIEETKSNAKPE